MTERETGTDPLERLRRADPAAGDAIDPSDARARAVLEEVLQMSTDHIESPTAPVATPWFRKPAILGAAAAAVLVAGIFATTIGGDDTDPGNEVAQLPVDDGLAPGAGGTELTSCAVLFSPEELRNRQYAFQGTITDVAADGTTTFAVERVFSGDVGSTISLDGTAMNGAMLDPATEFGPGAAVLIAGDDGFVWTCGFTQLADEFSIPEWENAFNPEAETTSTTAELDG